MKNSKYIVVFLLSLTLFTNSYAVHCPLPSQLKHVPGQPWTLDPDYLSQGWIISSDSPANSSPWTTMPDNHPLYVQLYPNNPYPEKAGCGYFNIPAYGQGAVFVTHYTTIDPKTIAVPPFIKEPYEILSYRCDVVASNAAACHWG